MLVKKRLYRNFIDYVIICVTILNAIGMVALVWFNRMGGETLRLFLSYTIGVKFEL